MIGSGEYTTGYVPTAVAETDKGAGVVGITLFHLRSRGKVGSMSLCGTNGSKFPAIRTHFETNIKNKYTDSLDCSVNTFPADGTSDPKAYIAALDSMPKGSAVTVFTPDDTHFDITLAAVKRGLHVLTTKPLVKTLAEHEELAAAARENNVLVMCEVHKRFDPIYMDARDRIANLGDFSYFSSYMSQPKTQLETFRAWAGKSSDISYYLNSHHIDFHEWAIAGRARPVRVTACGATGVASAIGIESEDAITLMVQWENREEGTMGTAVYTSSWAAPRADVHSQQRFFYMGHKGEVHVDQAHRGYSVSTDEKGYASCNPLFMKYTPDPKGRFAGQLGYGYRSIEAFIDAVSEINESPGSTSGASFDAELPTVGNTMLTTAILEAGRRSLDHANGSGTPISILFKGSEGEDWATPVGYA